MKFKSKISILNICSYIPSSKITKLSFLVCFLFSYCKNVNCESQIQQYNTSHLEIDHDAERELKKAKYFSDQQKHDEAIVTLRNIVSKHKNTDIADKVQIEIGKIHLKRNKPEEALIEFKNVLGQHSPVNEDKRYYINKAREGAFFALLNLGKYDEAGQFFSENIKQYGYPSEDVQREIELKKQVIEKWRNDAPEKRAIKTIIAKYFAALERRDFNSIGEVFSQNIFKKRVDNLKSYLGKKNAPSKYFVTSMNILIEGDGACVEGELATQKLGKFESTLGEFYFELEKIDKSWKIKK